MCLTVDKRFHGKTRPFYPLWAEHDMYVYKILKKYRSGGETRYSTPYQHMVVKSGYEYYASDFGIDTWSSNGQVSHGLHSWTKRQLAARDCSYRDGENVFVAIIPQGSRYFVGTEGDVVSEKLIMLNKRRVWPWEKSKTLMNSDTAKVYNFNWDV